MHAIGRRKKNFLSYFTSEIVNFSDKHFSEMLHVLSEHSLKVKKRHFHIFLMLLVDKKFVFLNFLNIFYSVPKYLSEIKH